MSKETIKNDTIKNQENESKKLRLAAYVRVSTEYQTVENQKLAIRNYIISNPNIEIIDWFIDEGISAFKERPKFKKMMEGILAKMYDGLIAYKLDRIGRSVLSLHDTVKQIEKVKGHLVFVADHIDTSTAIGRFFFTLQSAFAEYEAEMIRERTKSGMARVKNSGSKSGKPIGRPFIKIDDKQIIELYNNGLGINAISKETKFKKSTIRKRLLKNNVIMRSIYNRKKKEKKED